ncbi:hypothetical protein Tco_1052599 [Tanacetum coccineum]
MTSVQPMASLTGGLEESNSTSTNTPMASLTGGLKERNSTSTNTDFKNLHPNDFEDLFLLNIQEKLNHLPKTDKIKAQPSAQDRQDPSQYLNRTIKAMDDGWLIWGLGGSSKLLTEDKTASDEQSETKGPLDTADKSSSRTSVQPVTQSKAPTDLKPKKKKIPPSS